MKTLIAITFTLFALNAKAETSVQIGNMQFSDTGAMTQQIGGMQFGNDGSIAVQTGGSTFQYDPPPVYQAPQAPAYDAFGSSNIQPGGE